MTMMMVVMEGNPSSPHYSKCIPGGTCTVETVRIVVVSVVLAEDGVHQSVGSVGGVVL